MTELLSADDQKRIAALAALDEIRDGMTLGLGTGSTAAHFVCGLGHLLKEKGWSVRGVPTSEATADLARDCDIPVVSLDDVGPLDLTVDGADELDAHLRLIKGGGAALLREKIVAAASKRLVIIADASKAVATLGAFALPVEVIRFGAGATARHLREVFDAAGLNDIAIRQRMKEDGEPVLTDSGNVIFDCACGRIADPAALSVALNRVPGVVENGLFVDLASLAFIGQEDGTIRRIAAPAPAR